jgi:aspartate/methionine/tyrosine aminotransferase
MTAGSERWIADRMHLIEGSGIRKIFELTKSIQDPINLSIGQPDFDVPELAKAAARAAIDAGANGYTLTPGIPALRGKIQAEVSHRLGHADREVMMTSGTSGGLTLALLTLVNPGDEVIVFDPYFVAYPQLITLAGGRMVAIDTYPDFDIDPDRVKAALTPHTKAIIVNSPSNPTGKVLGRDRLRDLAQLAQQRGIVLLSDEVYRAFTFDRPFCSPAEFNEDALVFDGFSKAYGMTGWRLGFAHGPRRIIDEMIKLMQFTYVCPPSIVQHAALAALDCDMSATVECYRSKRNRIFDGLKHHYDVKKPEGAFYIFPRAPGGNGTEFVTAALKHKLLSIPGRPFSQHDTHFRLSYAASDRTIDRGLEILEKLGR